MSPLGDLNRDLLSIVFEHLEGHARALAAVALSNRRWRAVALLPLRRRKAAFFAAFPSHSCAHLEAWLKRKRMDVLLDGLEHYCPPRQTQMFAKGLVTSFYPVAHLACEADLLRIVDCARNSGLAADAQRPDHADPLMTAAVRNYAIYANKPEEEAVRRQWIVKLLKWGANPTVLPGYQWSIHHVPPPLFWVLWNPRMVALLLEHSQHPLKLNQQLWRFNLGLFGPGEFKHSATMTPLMWLASGRRIGHPAVIAEETAIESTFLLLGAYPHAPELRADPRLRDEDGNTAASIARSLDRHVLAVVLEEACARMEVDGR